MSTIIPYHNNSKNSLLKFLFSQSKRQNGQIKYLNTNTLIYLLEPLHSSLMNFFPHSTREKWSRNRRLATSISIRVSQRDQSPSFIDLSTRARSRYPCAFRPLMMHEALVSQAWRNAGQYATNIRPFSSSVSQGNEREFGRAVGIAKNPLSFVIHRRETALELPGAAV